MEGAAKAWDEKGREGKISLEREELGWWGREWITRQGGRRLSRALERERGGAVVAEERQISYLKKHRGRNNTTRQ